MKIFRLKLSAGPVISAPGLLAGAIIALSALQQSCTGAVQKADQRTTYRLYCINESLEISTRTLDDIKWARGDKV